jgi:hypothetical protein
MVVHFLGWGVIFVCSVGLSRMVSAGSVVRSVDYEIIRGLAILSGLLSWSNLYLPIGFPVQFGVFALACIGWLTGTGGYCKRNSPRSLAWVIPYGVLFLALSAIAPNFYDTNLYHTQAILWKRDFAVVPGLGNLHGRLAFNSCSFFLNAFFSYGHQITYSLNALLLLMLLARIWENIRNNPCLRELLFNGVFLALYYFTIIFKGLNSPAPDTLAVVVLTYIAFMIRDGMAERNPVEATLLICFLFTVKLSMVLIPGFVFYLMWIRPAAIRRILAWSVFIILPYLLANWVQAGHVLYPSLMFNFGSVDWKIPDESVVQMKGWIEGFAKNSGVSPDQVLAQGFTQWFPVWFKRITFSQRILFIAFAGASIWSVLNFRRVEETRRVFLLVLMGSLAIWLLSAPDFRFALGFLAAFMAFFFDTFLPEALGRRSIRGLGLISALVFLGLAFKNSDRLAELEGSWFVPHPAHAEKLDNRSIGAHLFHFPVEHDRCGNAPIPCAPAISEGLRLRGPSLGDGFKIERTR